MTVSDTLLKPARLELNTCAPTPRIQLFFMAVFFKLGASMAAGLAIAFNAVWLGAGAGVVLLAWFALMLRLTAPQSDIVPVKRGKKLALGMRAAVVLLVVIITGEIVGVGAIFILHNSAEGRSFLLPAAGSVVHAFTLSDATALTQQAAENVLKGQNPYATANIITALQADPDAYRKLTPLRNGVFASDFPYPAENELRDLWLQAIATPATAPPEFESRFNYPAGSFLLPAPFVWLGITDLRLVMLILSLPAFIIAGWLIAPRWRWYFILALLLSVELWNAVAAGDISLLYLPFILLGWLLLKRNLWLSAICMGIAMATKQTAWFFLPFYLVLLWRTVGFKEGFKGGAVVAAVFAALNLPFIIADGGLWLTSILAPMSAGMFPMGTGVVAFVTSGLWHMEASVVFTAMEGLVMAAGLVWYWFNCRRYPHAGVILAILPLFFAWRSLWDYFYYADIILLALILAHDYSARPDASLPDNLCSNAGHLNI